MGFHTIMKVDCKNGKLPEKYKKVSEMANKMYLLSLKYNMTKHKDILKRIVKGFNIVLDFEKRLLPIVLSDVKSFKCD